MKYSLLVACLLVVVYLLIAPRAYADVVDSTVGGFTVKVTVDVAAPSAHVYQALSRLTPGPAAVSANASRAEAASST